MEYDIRICNLTGRLPPSASLQEAPVHLLLCFQTVFPNNWVHDLRVEFEGNLLFLPLVVFLLIIIAKCLFNCKTKSY